jgi:Zn-dependent protease with chaperone function
MAARSAVARALDPAGRRKWAFSIRNWYKARKTAWSWRAATDSLVMMNFFDAQTRARKHTARLFVFMAAAVLGVVVVAYLLAAAALGLWERVFAMSPREIVHETVGPPAGLWHPRLFFGLLFGTAALVAGAAWRKWRELRGGGAVVAKLLGARWVRPGTDELAERRLINVVEEMALASGMPMPVVFLLDREHAINAFAAGFKPSDAVIVVTRGAAEELSRDELQGVIGHEFSHILNGDMRMNVLLTALLFGLQFVALLGEAILGDCGERRGGGADLLDRYDVHETLFYPVAFIMAPARILAGLVVAGFGYAGYFAGKLIQAMISRQREFLADAASVQFTRNPAGIIGALKKIGMAGGAVISNPAARQLRHFFFTEPRADWLQACFATHPNWIARIHAINAGEALAITGEALAAGRLRVEGAPAFAGGPAVAAMAGFFTASAGTLSPREMERARALIEKIPAALRDAAHDPNRAPSLMAGLLLSHDGLARRSQWGMLHLQSGVAIDTVRRLESPLLALPRDTRLPLAQMAMPALRRLPGRRAAGLAATVMRLVEHDGHVSVFEYALMRVLRHHLLEIDGGPGARRQAGRAGRAEDGDVALAMAFLAWHGSGAGARDENAARAAFDAGLSALAGRRFSVAWEQVSGKALDYAGVDAALDRLAAAPGETKRMVLDAAARVVMADGKILPDEIELLRAIADSFDCPVPVLAGAEPVAESPALKP